MNHTGFDDNAVSYFFDYESGWLDLGEEMNNYLKFVKRLTSFVFVEENVEITHKVAYDFGADSYSLQKSALGGKASEWGQFEWGANGVYDVDDASAVAGTDVAEWASSIQLRTLDAPMGRSGQYIQVGLSLNTQAGEFALQQINLYAKVGRIAT